MLMGPYYFDALLEHATEDVNGTTEFDDATPEDGVVVNYAVYPWHRSGSLNADYNRNDGTSRTATDSKVCMTTFIV